MADAVTTVIGPMRRHPWRTTFAVGLLVLAGAAVATRDIISLALSGEDEIDLTLPMVEGLTPASPEEVVYRIDATRSMATVEVTEVLAGADNEVTLTTQGIAGDIGITGGDATTARFGEVEVNVHQLESDNSLRDKAIRHQYLESHDHRTVRLRDAVVTDVQQSSPTEATFTIDGTLDIRTESHPISFEGTATIDGDTLTATATSAIKMSEMGVGPITKVGLVSTSDDVRITLDLVAVDGRGFTPPTTLSVATVDTPSTDGGPSYAEDIAPILEENCASCHNDGQVGAQMLALDTAADAAEVADGLAVVTASGYMPPWPPSEEGVPLRNPRGLDESEVALITRWADAGAPLDVDPSTPIEAPEEPEVSVPDEDVVMTFSEPYVGDGTKRDDYRCFVLDPGFTSPSAVTGYQFHADETRVVHHALVYAHSPAKRARIDAADAADAGSGFDCAEAAGMGTGPTGGRLVGGWVPGQRPRDFEEGVGYLFDPGTFFVVQIHYHYEGTLLPDQSTMTLELADDPAAVVPLTTHTLVGPVELPCPPGSTGALCDRNAALVDARERFGTQAGMANALHRLCGTTPEGLGAESDGMTATTTCTYPVRDDGTIVDVLGHMHEIGTTYRMTLNKGTPTEKVLLDIPVWNFAWQLNYQPVDPVPVSRGDTLTVECSWDRSLRFDPDPQYIFFAEGTEDEMCFSTVSSIPRRP